MPFSVTFLMTASFSESAAQIRVPGPTRIAAARRGPTRTQPSGPGTGATCTAASTGSGESAVERSGSRTGVEATTSLTCAGGADCTTTKGSASFGDASGGGVVSDRTGTGSLDALAPFALLSEAPSLDVVGLSAGRALSGDVLISTWLVGAWTTTTFSFDGKNKVATAAAPAITVPIAATAGQTECTFRSDTRQTFT